MRQGEGAADLARKHRIAQVYRERNAIDGRSGHGHGKKREENERKRTMELRTDEGKGRKEVARGGGLINARAARLVRRPPTRVSSGLIRSDKRFMKRPRPAE